MTQNKRNIFVGLGVTAVAVVLIAQFVTDYPARGDQTSGTVTPAQRYRSQAITPASSWTYEVP